VNPGETSKTILSSAIQSLSKYEPSPSKQAKANKSFLLGFNRE